MPHASWRSPKSDTGPAFTSEALWDSEYLIPLDLPSRPRLLRPRTVVGYLFPIPCRWLVWRGGRHHPLRSSDPPSLAGASAAVDPRAHLPRYAPALAIRHDVC